MTPAQLELPIARWTREELAKRFEVHECRTVPGDNGDTFDILFRCVCLICGDNFVIGSHPESELTLFTCCGVPRVYVRRKPQLRHQSREVTA